jgi:hypothetical protein
MFEYTLNNHFKFGYNKNWFVDRVTEDDNWTVQYGQCERPLKDWREECKFAASTIYEKRQGLPIDILFSGGLDSEIMLRSFYEIKVPFNAHFVDYETYNRYDRRWAEKVCDSLNIKLNIHTLDIKKFWLSEDCLKIAEISKCVSPQLLTQQWLMSKVDGLPVLGSGECYTARTDIAIQKKLRESGKNTAELGYSDMDWVLVEREKIATWYRYPIKLNRPAVPGFFQYTPEMMLSFLDDSFSWELHNNKRKGKLSNSTSKFNICSKYWPEVKKRIKRSGFEDLRDEDYTLRKKLNSYYQMYHYEYWSEVKSLIKYLKKELNEMPDNVAPKMIDPADQITTYYKIIEDEQF